MYGQDVVIANKMESEGQPDKIKVSQATKDMLDKYFAKNGNVNLLFVQQEDVHIKKLNRDIKNYIVEKDEGYF